MCDSSAKWTCPCVKCPFFFAFLTLISDEHPLVAPRGATGRFSGVSGVGDAGNRKCRVNPVQTGIAHPANVDFSRVLDPDLRSAPIGFS